jgi:hypothetical protein
VKISFKASTGSGIAKPFEDAASGMSLEADCSTTFHLKVRSATGTNGRDNIFHALIVGAAGATYSGGELRTLPNDVFDLVPDNENPVSGKLEWAGLDGTNITLDYMAAFGTAQKDCVFTGLLFKG